MQGDEEFTSAFPKSVQPGKPKLTYVPTGWIKTSLGAHLEKVLRPTRLEDNVTYELVTVKRSRGGVVRRESLPGRSISVKSQFKVATDDFLISKRQIVHGACGIVPSTLEGSIVSNEYDVFRCLPTLDLGFLKYLSYTIYFQQTCFHSSIGVHVEKMIFKTERWLKFPFALPPYAEQVKIAEILSTWDRSIEAAVRLLENSKKRKKALMQQLLTGKKRLPGFGGNWKDGELGDLVTLKGGAGFPESMQGATVGEVPFIKVSDMNTAGNEVTINFSNNWLLNTELGKFEKSVMPQTAIIFAKVGAALLLNRVRLLSMPTLIDNNLMAAIPKDDRWQGFLYQVISTINFGSLVQEGALPSINQSQVSKIKIHYPSEIQEAERICKVLEDSDREISSISRRLELLKKERSALMQQLLTGRKRILSEAAA